jgi:hypothetical protein
MAIEDVELESGPGSGHAGAAHSVAALGAEARGGRKPFGADALIACDQQVRI